MPEGDGAKTVKKVNVKVIRVEPFPVPVPIFAACKQHLCRLLSSD